MKGIGTMRRNGIVVHIQIRKISESTLTQWYHPGFREKLTFSEQDIILIPRNVEPVTLSEISEYFHDYGMSVSSRMGGRLMFHKSMFYFIHIKCHYICYELAVSSLYVNN